jgi:hypothetical protein
MGRRWTSRRELSRLWSGWPTISENLRNPKLLEPVPFFIELLDHKEPKKPRKQLNQSLLGFLAMNLEPKIKYDEWKAVLYLRKAIESFDPRSVDYLADGVDISYWVEGFCYGAIQCYIVCILEDAAEQAPSVFDNFECKTIKELASLLGGNIQEKVIIDRA